MDEIKSVCKDSSQIQTVVELTPKTNAENCKAYRERKQKNNSLQTTRTTKIPPKTNAQNCKAYRERKKKKQASQIAGPSGIQQFPVNEAVRVIPIEPAVYNNGQGAPFTPGGPDAERVEVEAEIYCHGNPSRIVLTPGELLAIRPQLQTRNYNLPRQVSDYTYK